METVYIGNTLVNDIFLGSRRMDDAFTQPVNALAVEYLVVGGGGGGGEVITGPPLVRGGGGGAGGLLSGSARLGYGIKYNIQVGGGNTVDFNAGAGQNSFLTGSNLYLFANGGGFGAGAGSATAGNGGSGGGARQNSSAFGTGSAGQGNSGAAGTSVASGGGGGAGSAASGVQTGSGLFSAITGTLTHYAFGGSGSNAALAGVTPARFTGGGGGGAGAGSAPGNGADGIVVIRYPGSQKATGGTVTTDGGFTVHEFKCLNRSSSAQFTLQLNPL
jgi:hypothetical protein